jgi:hypothetical protein
VTAIDAQGVAGSGYTNVTVEAASSSPPPAATSNSTGISAAEADGIIAGVALAVVLAVVAIVLALMNRRDPPKP